MTGFREVERRIRRKLKKCKAAGLSDFEAYLVERYLSRACHHRLRVRKMHDHIYQRAIGALHFAESVLILKGVYLFELKRNAAKSKETLQGADVPGQDAG